MATFAERLKKIRATKNWTQAQLAAKLGISPSTLSRYETGKTVPSFKSISHYSEILNVTPEWLSGQAVPRKRRPQTLTPVISDVSEPVSISGSASPEPPSEISLSDSCQPPTLPTDPAPVDIPPAETPPEPSTDLPIIEDAFYEQLPESEPFADVADDSAVADILPVDMKQKKRRFTRRYVILIAVICLLVTLQTLLFTSIFGDSTAPVVTVSSQTIEYGQTLHLSDIATATDNRSDNVVMSIVGFSPTDGLSISDNSLTFTSPGTYSVEVSAEDKKGNIATDMVTVAVQDRVAPELSLSPPTSPIEYGQSLEISSYLSVEDVSETSCYISSVEGSSYIIATDKESLVFQTPGEYVVTVEACDAYDNTSSASMSVSVIDTTAPEIYLSQDTLELEFGEALYLPSETIVDIDWVSISDVSDVSFAFTSVLLDGSDFNHIISADNTVLNFNALGLYTVTMAATDVCGNTANAKFSVNCVDTVAPKLDSLPNEFTLTEYDTAPNYLSGVSASDNVDGDLTSVIIVEALNVSYGVPGSYSISYRVYDSSGNLAEKEIPVNILDTTAPSINLSSSSVSLETGAYAPDYAGYLEYIYDASDGYISDVEIDDSDVNYNRAGTYTVYYRVSDSSGNSSRATFTVYISDPKPVSTSSSGGTVYITKTGEKFHRGSCSYLKKSKISISRSAAIAQGYTACSRCDP